MRERLGVFLVLLGTFLAARIAVALVLTGRPPAAATLALHAATIPLVQALVLGVRRREVSG